MLTTKALQPDLTTANYVVKGLENCRVDEFLKSAKTVQSVANMTGLKGKNDQIKQLTNKNLIYCEEHCRDKTGI